jgi:HNH endonuclease
MTTATTPRHPRKLTAKRVRQLLDCDPAAGTLTWRERPGDTRFNKRFAGKRAGSLDPKTGYLRVRIDRKLYQLHRVVWVHSKGYWPPNDLDHHDGDKTNCALGNLRPVTDLENSRNCKRKPKPSGAPLGSWIDPKSGLYVVWIRANHKRVFLGRFASASTAARVYLDAAEELHGEFSVTERPRQEVVL